MNQVILMSIWLELYQYVTIYLTFTGVKTSPGTGISEHNETQLLTTEKTHILPLTLQTRYLHLFTRLQV